MLALIVGALLSSALARAQTQSTQNLAMVEAHIAENMIALTSYTFKGRVVVLSMSVVAGSLKP